LATPSIKKETACSVLIIVCIAPKIAVILVSLNFTGTIKIKNAKNAPLRIVIFVQIRVLARPVKKDFTSLKLKISVNRILISCQVGCINCYEGPELCIQCSVNRFSLEEKIVKLKNPKELINHTDGGSSVFILPSSDVITQKICVAECPDKLNENYVVTDYLESTCK
jgi:hypothetical protein